MRYSAQVCGVGPDSISMMTDARKHTAGDLSLVAGSIGDLDTIMTRMREDFPPSELKSQEQVERLMSGGQYRLWLARGGKDEEVLGYAFVFAPVSPNILWLDYIAIETRLRGRGYGARFFNMLLRTGRRGNLGMLLEVEKADSDEPRMREMQVRRLRFYQRLGAIELAVPYVFPASDPPMPMHLFFKPGPKVSVLSREPLRESIEAAYDYIHADVPTRRNTLSAFIDVIEDHSTVTTSISDDRNSPPQAAGFNPGD